MKINIQRTDKENNTNICEYDISSTEQTVLNALEEIKETIDESLSYRCGCESGVCGSCAVKVNGVEKLACKSKIKENDLIEPLKYSKVIKDLVVDLDHEQKVISKAQAHLHQYNQTNISIEDEKLIDRQSNCILCQSCYSSCPVYEVNKNFLGPYALTRALRYVNDKKEQSSNLIVDAVQKDGIWDCTLCGNCTMVCPQFIDPKSDIMNLRMKAAQQGYTDPNMQNFGSINNEFNTGFDPSGGFNPNGF